MKIKAFTLIAARLAKNNFRPYKKTITGKSDQVIFLSEVSELATSRMLMYEPRYIIHIAMGCHPSTLFASMKFDLLVAI